MTLAPRKSKKKSSKKNKPKTPLEHFYVHWEEIEKLEKRLSLKDKAKKEMMARFDKEIRPFEEAQCQAVYRQAERLISFAKRKSLLVWQKEQLADWIEKEMKFIESHPFNGGIDLTPLHDQLHQNVLEQATEEQIEAQVEELRWMLEGHFGEDIDVSEEQLRACIGDVQAFRALLAQLTKDATQRESEQFADDDQDEAFDFGADPFADDEPFADEDFDEQWNPFSDQAKDDEAELAKLDTVISKSSLKQLYRKLALALHPDRVQDPEEKQRLDEQMVTLTKAWKEKDAFALLSMAQTHLPQDEAFLSEENLAAINPLLKRKIEAMKHQLNVTGDDDSLMSLVYRKFKRPSKKATEAEFADHLAYLKQDIADIEERLKHLTTLKALKPYLEQHRAEQQSKFLDLDELDMLFGFD